MRLVMQLLVSDDGPGFSPLRSLLARRHPGREYLLRRDRTHNAQLLIIEGRVSTRLLFDEMWHVAMELCFRSLARLLDGRPTTYQVMWNGKTTELCPHGDRVEICRPGLAPLSVPRDPLVELLYRKGRDYVELLCSLNDDRHGPTITFLRPHADEAERIVAAHGLSTARPTPWPDD